MHSENANSDPLGKIANYCMTSPVYKTFHELTDCIKRLSNAVNHPGFDDSDPLIRLYFLQMDKIIIGVDQKAISDTKARAELEKSYLDYLSRIAEHQIAAAELAAQIQVRENMATQFDAQRAADDMQKRKQEQEEENRRRASQLELEHIKAQCIAIMSGRGDSAGRYDPSKVTMCYSDPYAHLRPENQPRPSIQCLSLVVGGYGYTNCQ
jgi:hypothetical protein